MDSYSYQNISQNPNNDLTRVHETNTNNGSYSLPDIIPSYHHDDPRLNYAYYNSTSNIALPNIQPDLHTYDLSLPQTSVVPIKSDEELWVETWLSKIGKIQINLNSTIQIAPCTTTKQPKSTPKNYLRLHEAKCSLKNCLQVISKLHGMQELLKTNAASMSSTEWRKRTLEIGSLKDEFSQLFSHFEQPEILMHLKRAVEKRRKKRASFKRRKQQHVELRLEREKQRQKAHKEINRWLEDMKEKVEQAKREEIMKKDADCVLAEVTKKKSDARKSLSLIASLIKLRHVREQAAIQRGEKVSSDDRNAFMKVTEHLIKIWTDALDEYSKEEHNLRVMLERNATEDTNTVRVARENKIAQEWEETFFGPMCTPSPIYWGLTAADNDLETFIAIRKSWDTFLTKSIEGNGSKIPIGWVLPNSLSSESWTKYLNPL